MVLCVSSALALFVCFQTFGSLGENCSSCTWESYGKSTKPRSSANQWNFATKINSTLFRIAGTVAATWFPPRPASELCMAQRRSDPSRSSNEWTEAHQLRIDRLSAWLRFVSRISFVPGVSFDHQVSHAKAVLVFLSFCFIRASSHGSPVPDCRSFLRRRQLSFEEILLVFWPLSATTVDR